MTRTRYTIATLTIATLAALGLTSCQVYPSGCIRIPSSELPFPYSYNTPLKSVTGPQGVFVGVSQADPDVYFTDTWHGPARYNQGWLVEYASAMNCMQTGGAYAGG